MAEQNFKLLDLTGSESVFDYNANKNILVYSIGCMIVYWELSLDKKLYIKYHEGIIGALKFTKSGNYLISVDKLFSPHLVVWEVPTMQVYFQNYLPLNNTSVKEDLKYLREKPQDLKSNLVSDIYLEFLSRNNFLIILNVESKQLLFSFEFGKEINLKYDSTIEVDAACLGLKSFPDTNIFVTVEEKTLKIWKMLDDSSSSLKIKLITKIHLKQKLLKDSLHLCEYLKLVNVLNDSGSCIILDDLGNFLVCLTCNHRDEIFTSLYVMNEVLLLGTDKGNISVYSLNGFKLLYNFTYDFSNKSKSLLNNVDYLVNMQNKNRLAVSSSMIVKEKISGPSVEKILSNEENDVIVIKYSDNSMFTTNLSSLQYLNKISNYSVSSPQSKYNFHSFSHFGTIKDILWLLDEPKTFFTCSEDQSLMLWTYRGDKWVNNYFDLLKTFDSNLNNFSSAPRIALSNSTHLNLNYIQVLALHPRYQNTLVGGDNKGNLYIFDIESLNKGTNSTKKIVAGNFPINSLSFSANGNYLAVGFETGLVILTDFYSDCNFCIKLEDHFTDTNTKSVLSSSFVHVMKLKNGLLKNENMTMSAMTYLNPPREEYLQSSTINKTNHYYSLNNNETSLRIITLKDSSTFRIQNITIKNNTFLKSTFRELTFDYRIKSAVMHPSEDYLLVLLEPNIISINKIETNQKCGEIIPNMNIYDFRVDPSGLYIGILGEYLSHQNDENLNKDELNLNPTENTLLKSNRSYLNKNMITIQKNKISSIEGTKFNNNFNTFSQDKNPYAASSNLSKQRNIYSNPKDEGEFKSSKTSISFYEIGTGKFSQGLNHNFKISNFKFSSDGRFLNITSDSGCVSVWQMPKEMRENIMSVLEEMRRNMRFWDSFLINFYDKDRDENFNYNNIITKSLDKTSISYVRKNSTSSQNPNLKKSSSKVVEREKPMNMSKGNPHQNNNLHSHINIENNYAIKESKEIQTSRIKDDILSSQNNNYNNLNNANILEVDDKSAKSIYINLTTKDEQHNFQKNNLQSNHPVKSKPENNYKYNKSIQTSNRDNFWENYDQVNKRKTDEWVSSHKYERMGLENENMRIINKDPSIYPAEQPSVLQGRARGREIQNLSKSNLNMPMSNVNQSMIEEISKRKNDETRNKNIERAMRELEIGANQTSRKLSDKENLKSTQSENFTNNYANYGNNNYYINNTKEKKVSQALPEPEDIDDLLGESKIENFSSSNNIRNFTKAEGKNLNTNGGNFYTDYHQNLTNNTNIYKYKDSIADEIEFAYDNIDNFEKMHNIK
jgi:hypothetical protein